MKIVVLFPRFGTGGIAKASTFVANALCKKGHEIVCVSMSDDENIQIFASGIRTLYIPYEIRGEITVFRKLYFLASFRKLLKRENPDYLLALGVDIARIGVIASVFLKIHIVTSERGNPYVYSKRQREKYIRALRKCDHVVFQTSEAQKYYPDDIKGISTIIPNPCYIRNEHDLVKSDLSSNNIMVVSRISEEKNVLGIVKAFKILQENLGCYNLCIFGDGNQKKQIEKYVEEQNIENVYFAGNRAEPFRECKNPCLYVINSFTEGMPNSLIEAMLYGIPCVATDCPPGGVRFLADGGRRVYLVPVNDHIELSKAMIKVLKDNEFAQKLVKEAEDISVELSPDRIAKKWVDLFG